MTITDEVKEFVRKGVLADLEQYFEDAEEAEDDSSLDPDLPLDVKIEERKADFYLALQIQTERK